MKGEGFAYFCWYRQKRPDELPPGLKMENGVVRGSPTLAGKYWIPASASGLPFHIPIHVQRADTLRRGE